MNLTAREVAEKIRALLDGDASLELAGVAAPERAGAKHLIYVESAKHAVRALQSAALCVVAGEGISLPGKTVLRSTQPKVAFAKAAGILLEARPIASGIHPTAIVAPMAQIGEGLGIGPYVVIGEDAHIGNGTQIGAHSVIGAGCWVGENCKIHARVTLYAGVRIGNDVEIHSGAVIGADGFGYAFDGNAYWKFPQAGIVEIGDQVEIGANATIDRGSLDDTRISVGVKIDNLVHVGHNVQIGEHTVIAAQTGISGSSRLGHHVVCGGQVGIADHCTLEDQSIAGAQAGIPTGKTIRSGQTVWGTPARPLDKFKEAYAWFARLPELGERIKKLEEKS
ncbi:MAG TPA: UDP-3-O-(3-hydroxymyristoyl)glucosamine N-acyltransferase [Verrucomicrobiae bacterium]|nr:UDP-3-O-(3-hydroxymyristoyl)glucosamine N-acyltransferase [Verrucomicrobiae bacterium]